MVLEDTRKIKIDKTRCMGCGRCKTVCSFNAIKNYTIDPVLCRNCGLCIDVCKRKAISAEIFSSSSLPQMK